ncbi:hypothetical protein [Pseudocnuella soli]|uniref:hypothetical protein n=1 Tax=Pseudocnuella soli TaxID=2502779 RepID=UPI00104BB0AE|nr:hypothetical protein [Pseudocnuella soli]
MKKVIYAMLLPLVVVSGLVFANHKPNIETPKTSIAKPPTAADRNAALEQWEATPEGIRFKQWEASAAGRKVYASEAKINKSIRDYTNLEAVVTALALPPGSRLGFGFMVNINGDDFIVSFGPQQSNEFQQLQRLNLGDKILIRSRVVSHAPKYSYPILSADYVERDNKVVFKRVPKKGGC